MSAESLAIPEKPRHKSGSFSTGLALFSMFFGAGNLIFPLLVGKSAASETPAALMGLGLSAVAFPLLGLVAMMLYKGDLKSFLERLGKHPAFILLFLLQMTQGPIGSMPRLFTLMHASVRMYFPDLSLLVFSIGISVVVFLLTFRPQKIVALLGVILTPFLLLSMGALIVCGMISPPPVEQVSAGSGHYFIEGLKGGYQTMDLIAALLFATVIIPHLSRDTDALSPEEAEWVVRKKMKRAILIAAGLLMISYIGLCWLSSHYSWTLENVKAPEDLLGAISIKILGPWGGLVSSLAIFLACLTTAISLAAVFSSYLEKDLFKGKLSSTTSLVLTLLTTAAMANLGFSGIMKLVGPILEILYPAIIVLCLVNIGYRLYRVQSVKAPVYFVLGFALGCFCFG